jgi:hypothetical protein
MITKYNNANNEMPWIHCLGFSLCWVLLSRPGGKLTKNSVNFKETNDAPWEFTTEALTSISIFSH